MLRISATALTCLKNRSRGILPRLHRNCAPFLHEPSKLLRLEARADELDKHIIEEGSSRMDVTVLQMARIVRATLKQPERMRAFERHVYELKRRMPRIPLVRDVNGRPPP